MTYTYKQLQEISATKAAVNGQYYECDNGDMYVGENKILKFCVKASNVFIEGSNLPSVDLSRVVNENTDDIANFKATNVVEIDFGTEAGGSNYVELSVGSKIITSDSYVLLSMISLETADHNTIEHQVVDIKLTYGDVIDYTSFKIFAFTDLRLSGKFNVKYSII